MKKIVFTLGVMFVVCSAIFSQNIPKKLIGNWEAGSTRYEITDSTIKMITDKKIEQITAVTWKIKEYDEEMGFLCGEIIENKNMGYDVTASTTGHVGILYFKIESKKVVIFCSGIKNYVPAANKYDYHEKAEYREKRNAEFTRTK